VTVASTTKQPRRADARRNRERLIAAASQTFAAHGIDVPLDMIAREAGVGNATMYRNFPTRDAILEAVLQDRYETLAASAKHQLTVTPTDAALLNWLRDFIAYAQTFRGLPDPVLATLHDDHSALAASCKAMRTTAARLLTRAQRDGTITTDITATDLFTHATAIAWATQRAPHDPHRVQRLLTTLTRGLRPDHA
jgi:AcrR family transcriptional regulator